MKASALIILHLLTIILIASCSSNNKTEPYYFNNAKDYENNLVFEENGKLKNILIQPINAEAPFEVSFVDKVVFSDADENFIGSKENIAVDKHNNVYIAVGGLGTIQSIYVFQPDGQYIKNIGRKGRGPGEFEMLSNISIRSDTLFAYDNIQKRITIFFLKDAKSNKSIVPDRRSLNRIEALDNYLVSSDFYPVADGKILMKFNKASLFINAVLKKKTNKTEKDDRWFRYYLINEEGEVDSNQIFQQKDTGFQDALSPFNENRLPYARSTLISIGPNDKIYSAWTEDFLIKIFSPNGEYERAIYFPIEKSTLNPDKIIEKYKRYPIPKSVATGADHPKTWPALNDMFIDDEGRIWVSTITDDDENYEWWILNNKGELISKFNWPGKRLDRNIERKQISLVKNGYMYIHEKDTLTDDIQVARYRIVFKRRVIELVE